MKTTNKILIVGLLAGLATTTYFILKVSSFISIHEPTPSGYTQIEEVEVDGIKSLSIEKGVIVDLFFDAEESLSIVTDTALRKYLSVEVDNKLLKIHMTKTLHDTIKVKAKLTVANLNEIKVANKAILKSEQFFRADSLNIKASNGGTIDMNVELANLNCEIKNGAKVNLTGQVDSISVSAYSSGKLNADKLVVARAKVEAMEHSFVHFNVTGSLDVKSMQGSVVKYNGEPRIRNMEVDQGGELIKL